MSEQRLQILPFQEQDQVSYSDQDQHIEDIPTQNKGSTRPPGRPRGRGRPKLNTKTISQKKTSDQQFEEEVPKQKQKIVCVKQQNQIQGYIRIIDYLKKIDCDEISFQNKMNPYHGLTAACFWYMISAEYFSYDFYAKNNPSEAANNILNRMGKLAVQLPMRFIKNTHQGSLLQFETEQVKKNGQNIVEYLSHIIPAPSLNKSQIIEKKLNLTTVTQDNQFISSTRAILFNYIRRKCSTSDKWSNIKNRLSVLQPMQSRQTLLPRITFQQDKQDIIDAFQLDILSRQVKRKKSQKRKSQRTAPIQQIQQDQQKKVIDGPSQQQKDSDIKNISEEQIIENNIKSESQHDQPNLSNEYDKEEDFGKKILKNMTADEVLLSGILHMPLDKVISILQSSLTNKYELPQIQPIYMPIPKSDPLQFINQLHDQEQKYLQYLKQLQIKQYRTKIQKSQNIIQEQERQIQVQDAKCQICTDGDYTDDNLIVFCSKCNISLHQKCIGLVKVPADSWVCDACQAFGPKGINLPCPLCNVKGGAMKRTNIHIDNNIFKELNHSYHEYTKRCPFNKQKQQYLLAQFQQPEIKDQTEQVKDDKEELYYDYFNKSTYPLEQPACHYVWVHYVCAIWVPQCYFQQKNGTINIKGIENVEKKRFKHQCFICKKSKAGACIKCEDQQCKRYYHPECARKKRVYMEQLNLQKIKYLIFCSEHEPLKLIREMEYKNKNNRDQITKFARAIQKYIETYKIAYFPFKLNKIVPKSLIQTFQPNEKEIQVVQIPQQTDQEFLKTLIMKLSKTKLITFTVIKTDNGFKVTEVQQPSRRDMRKCLNRYDDFWVLQNGQTPQDNWKRYEKIMQQNKFLKDKIQIFLNGGSLRKQIKKKVEVKKCKTRGRNAKQKVQTHIEQEGGIFCICRKPYENQLDMFECQICSEWYHFNCIGFIGTQQDARNIEFRCMKCLQFQSDEQKKPIMEKCLKYFAIDSVYLNYRPSTPILMSEDQNQISEPIVLEESDKRPMIEDSSKSSKQNKQFNISDQPIQQIKLLEQTTSKSEQSKLIDPQNSKLKTSFPSNLSFGKGAIQKTLTDFLGKMKQKQKDYKKDENEGY